jgi:hypothetical protein
MLGRHRAGSAFTKHHIKATDRLLGNSHLHTERDAIYRAIFLVLCWRESSAHSFWSTGPTPMSSDDG